MVTLICTTRPERVKLFSSDLMVSCIIMCFFYPTIWLIYLVLWYLSLHNQLAGWPIYLVIGVLFVCLMSWHCQARILIQCSQLITHSSVSKYSHYTHGLQGQDTVYPKKYAHGFCFAVLCCGYTLTDFPLSIRLTSLALWQSNDCPSASKATLMNMDKYFMWIHYERLHNHNKAKHNKTVCIFLGIYCKCWILWVHCALVTLFVDINRVNTASGNGLLP